MENTFYLTMKVAFYSAILCCVCSTVIPTSQPVVTAGGVDQANQATGAGENISTTAQTNATTSPTFNSALEERLALSRIMRLYTIQRQVMDQLGWSNTPNIDRETKNELLRRMQPTVFVTRQKFCYYPICDLPMVELPDYVNRSIWFDASSRNVRYYFAIEFNDDPNMEITSAVLKLHLKRREDCPCAFEGDQTTSRLHIKVYQYRKPVRSISRLRHSNMRLIDAKMVTWDSARWVSLQVTDAVNRIVTRGRRNGGFEVHVRDTAENVLDAKTVIDPTVCTSTTVYNCSPEQPDGIEEVENYDPNYSPVLEISSTTTRHFPFS